MVHRHMERCSASLIIREMQIKTTMRYHLISVRMVIVKKAINNLHVGKDVKERESWHTIAGNINWCSHCGKQSAGSWRN